MYASRLYVPAHKVDINIDRVAILPEPLKIKLDVFTFDWKELYDVFQIDNSIQEGYLYVSELGITPYALLEIDKIVWENA